MKTLPPSIDLLRRFVAESRTDKSIGNRLKMLLDIRNLDESGLDSWSKSVLRRYNAKPCLTRPQHEFFVGPNLTHLKPGSMCINLHFRAQGPQRHQAPSCWSQLERWVLHRGTV